MMPFVTDIFFAEKSKPFCLRKGSTRVAELGSGVVLGDVAVFGSDKRRTATATWQPSNHPPLPKTISKPFQRKDMERLKDCILSD